MVAMATFFIVVVYLANSQLSVYRTIGPLVVNCHRFSTFLNYKLCL